MHPELLKIRVLSYHRKCLTLNGITMTTLEVKLSLPDSLAKEAQAAGLLAPEEIEKLLREEIRRRAVGELFEAMDRMAAVEGPPMTEDEIQAEIDAFRATRRVARSR
jgi:hypothetical protein